VGWEGETTEVEPRSIAGPRRKKIRCEAQPAGGKRAKKKGGKKGDTREVDGDGCARRMADGRCAMLNLEER